MSEEKKADAAEGGGDDASISDDKLKQFIESTRTRIQEWQAQRELNLNPSRPEESVSNSLDSSLKKNTAFVKKLKTLTESQRETVLREFDKLNLAKYVDEAADSLSDAKLKMSDVGIAVELACRMHRRYAEFGPSLLNAFKKQFPKKKDDKIANAAKLRVDLRLFTDLLILGVLPEKDALSVLGATLVYLVNTDKTTHNHAPLLTTFLKYCGEEFVGVPPRSYRLAAEKSGQVIPVCTIMSAEHRQKVLTLLNGYYDSLIDRVKAEHTNVGALEQRNKRLYETKGEIFEDAKQRLTAAKQSFEKLKQLAVNMAEVLDAVPPSLSVNNLQLDDDESAALQLIGVDVGSHLLSGTSGSNGLWEDEEARVFYETLPELREMLPGILYKESEQATLAPVEEKLDVLNAESDIAKLQSDGTETDNASKEKSPSPSIDDGGNAEINAGESDKTETKDDSSKGFNRIKRKELTKAEQMLADLDEYDEDEYDIGCVPAIGDDDVSQGGSIQKELMDDFERRMPNMVSRKMIDEAAVEFVTNMNTKINRRRLLRTLKEVPRSRIDLLPFYARLVRILQPVMPDVGTELVQLLTKELRGHIHFKNQMRIESKLKCCKFIGELVKFGVCPKSEALSCLQKLLFDMRHHNIDMACALLESCGLYLYRSPTSHRKTMLLCEQMLRKKQNAVNMDQRYQFMIDNAYYHCNPPPEGSNVRVKLEIPPLELYVERLLYVDLNRLNVEKTLKQFRKFDWEDEKQREWLLCALASPYKCKFGHIQWMACILSGLMYYHDWIGYGVVDAILEDIRVGMEVNHPRLNQRRLAAVKYLGEMYNYRVIDSSVLFSTWYSFITFGVVFDATEQVSVLDPPTHLFRIRLACCLLDTCGDYFVRGTSKKKLDCFILYLQRYYWQKRSAENVWSTDHPFPFEVIAMFMETIEKLRDKFSFAKNLQEAEEAVEEMVAKYREQAEEVFKSVKNDSMTVPEQEEEEYANDDRPLNSIDEDEEQNSETASDTGVSDEEVESDAMESDEDQLINVKSSAHKFDEEDEEQLRSMFDRMMMESVQSRANEQAPNTDMSIPTNVRDKIHKQIHFESDEDEDAADDGKEENGKISLQHRASKMTNGNAPTMAVALMTRGKANKPTLKTVKVSADDAMAQNWSAGKQAEQHEQETIKNLTLNIAVRMEEEENEEHLNALRDSLMSSSTRPAANAPSQPERRPPGTLRNQIFGDNWN